MFSYIFGLNRLKKRLKIFFVADFRVAETFSEAKLKNNIRKINSGIGVLKQFITTCPSAHIFFLTNLSTLLYI